jgi:SAM-dependent methyltransferase
MSDKNKKLFNPELEIIYHLQDPAKPPSLQEQDILEADMRHWVPQFPELFRGKVILDLASGRGTSGILIQRKFAPRQVICLDLSLNRLKAALSWRKQLNAPDLICASVFELPFPDKTFDLIIANSFLHHLPNLEQAAQEIGRVLKPGGVYIGREPNFNNPFVRWWVFSRFLTWISPVSHTDNEYPLSSQEIESAFLAANCDPELQYFWRRIPKLQNPFLSVAISVRIYRR